MRKIKDRILLGTVSGVLAGQAAKIVMGQVHTKSHDYRFRTGASLFLPKKEVKASTVESRIISSIMNNALTSASGILITYLFYFTGRDFALIKGAGIGVMQWIGIYGLLSKLELTIKSNDPTTHILSAVDHGFFGALTGLLVSKIGDDSLFPDGKLPGSKPGEPPQLSSLPQSQASPPIASMASPGDRALARELEIKPIKTIKLTRKLTR